MLREVCEETKRLLGLPDDYLVGVVPASDTGAFEMAMWSMLGARGVDVFAWESFGKTWMNDIVKDLTLPDVNIYEADYGVLPDLSLPISETTSYSRGMEPHQASRYRMATGYRQIVRD